MSKGWKNESQKHAMASKGIKTKNGYCKKSDTAMCKDPEHNRPCGTCVIIGCPHVNLTNNKTWVIKTKNGEFIEDKIFETEEEAYKWWEANSKKYEDEHVHIKKMSSKGMQKTSRKSQIRMGIEVESEHTETMKKIIKDAKNGHLKSLKYYQKMVAEDHIDEIRDYYTRLKKMEKEAGE